MTPGHSAAIGPRIAAWRHRLGYTQTVAAKELGVSQNTVAKWECGACLCGQPITVLLLCWHLEGCPPEFDPLDRRSGSLKKPRKKKGE